MKIAIAIPSGDTLHADMAFSLMAALDHIVRHRRDIGYTLLTEKNSLLHVGRHRLVCLALGMKVDAILFVDSDMVVPYDFISRLCDASKDIIGCNALRRYPPHQSCGENLDGSPIHYGQSGQSVVSRIGTGVILINTKVFKDIGPPYFETRWEMEEPEKTAVSWVGEDFVFCSRAIEKGYKIHCHHDLSKQIYHLGVKPYGQDTRI